jgi:hypothetical protein
MPTLSQLTLKAAAAAAVHCLVGLMQAEGAHDRDRETCIHAGCLSSQLMHPNMPMTLQGNGFAATMP